jgi:hypothetical protein
VQFSGRSVRGRTVQECQQALAALQLLPAFPMLPFTFSSAIPPYPPPISLPHTALPRCLPAGARPEPGAGGAGHWARLAHGAAAGGDGQEVLC